MGQAIAASLHETKDGAPADPVSPQPSSIEIEPDAVAVLEPSPAEPVEEPEEPAGANHFRARHFLNCPVLQLV